MGFSSLPSGLVDFMASQPAVGGGPRVIEPEPDEPTTRPRRAMQLDASDAGRPEFGPQLDDSNQPFDYSKILNRGATDSGQPQMDTSPAPMVSSGGPQISNAASGPTMGMAGAASQPPAMPPVPLYTRNKNSAGQVHPIADTYQQSVDANGNHIGKLSRFGNSFLAGGGFANPVQGIISGLLGLAAPDLGNRAKFNVDNARFQHGLQQDISNERADPGFQKQLDAWQLQAEVPAKAQLYGIDQEASLRRQRELLTQRGEQTIDQIHERGDEVQKQIELRNKGALEKVHATYDEKSSAQLNQSFKDMKAEAADPNNINYGLSDEQLLSKAAQGIRDKQELANKLKESQVANYARLASDSKTRLDQSQQRIGIALTNAQTAQARLAQSGASLAQRAQNESVVNQLKALGSHAASLRREHATQAEILNSMNTSPEQKDAAEKAIQGINKDLNDLDVQQRTITGAPARGAKGAPPAGKVATQDDVDRAAKQFPHLTKDQIIQKFKDSGYTIQ